jgi:ribosomal protein S18 acetylase RimI-like enzyme
LSARVRGATADDAAEIGVAAWRQGYRGIVPDEIDPRQGWNPERIRERWASEDPDSGVERAVAELEGVVRGFIVTGPSRDARADPDIGEIWVLNVHPAAWRRGLGRSLVEHALTRLRERGFREVTLWTPAGSERARSFYEALRFVHDGARQRRPEFGRALEVRYRQPL